MSSPDDVVTGLVHIAATSTSPPASCAPFRVQAGTTYRVAVTSDGSGRRPTDVGRSAGRSWIAPAGLKPTTSNSASVPTTGRMSGSSGSRSTSTNPSRSRPRSMKIPPRPGTGTTVTVPVRRWPIAQWPASGPQPKQRSRTPPQARGTTVTWQFVCGAGDGNRTAPSVWKESWRLRRLGLPSQVVPVACWSGWAVRIERLCGYRPELSVDCLTIGLSVGHAALLMLPAC